MTPEELMEIHDFLDDLVVRRGYFREPLLATGLELGSTPFFAVVVYETQPDTVYLGFSVDQALNATTLEREVQNVADVCVQAVKGAFPKAAAYTFTTRFVHGGVPPRTRS
jgi:hypothetical protein